jgi:AcrR family transcriptional regulator
MGGGNQRLRGDVRRQQIIKAALKVMSQQGYPKVTIRNVAENAGIHFATLQYYYKNKRELLQALFDYKLEEDSRALHLVMDDDRRPAKERFTTIINLVLAENRRPVVIGYFLQLWALSNHNKAAAKNLDNYYDAYLGWIIEIITLVNPSLTIKEKKMRAHSILALLEGLVPTYTRARKNRKPDKSFDQHLVNIIWQIATG